MHLKVMMELRPKKFFILIDMRWFHCLLVKMVWARIVSEQKVIMGVVEAINIVATSNSI